jgi:tRNA threonylcarbamoyladenosine biosynthesis protein TsaE
MPTTGVSRGTSTARVYSRGAVISGPLDESALTGRARALGRVLRELGAPGADADPGAEAATLLLDGPMGAGKTTFTRALAEGLELAHPERVCSPTFTLCMVHPGRGSAGVTLVHVDLFRLADADDEGMGGAAGFDALDLEEITADAAPTGDAGPRVLVVEWARKWSTPPADHLVIQLRLAEGGTRRIVHAEARGPRSAAILARWSEALERSALL